MDLDNLDKKIIQHLSIGVESYDELARLCNVTRNTVYRRIATLESKGIIKNTLHCVVNLGRMDLMTINIGVRIAQIDLDKAINLLATNKYVKFLWRTFGDHNLMLIAFCSKGKEGLVIHEIRSLLEELGYSSLCVSVGFVWEKMNLSPFEEQTDTEERIIQILEHRI